MGFSINEIVQTRGWKNFMSKVYGIGASVVLMGAMFKIMHWPGSGLMLVIGLSTEAFIFFTSAFEPLHQEWDWSLAYPELAGMHDDIEDSGIKKREIDAKKTALEKFDSLINNAEITPELFQKLGKGLKSLNDTTEKLSDVSDATIATNNYISSFEKASHKVNEFSDLYGQSVQAISNSAKTLALSYDKSTEVVNGSVTDFANSFSKTGNDVTKLLSETGQKITDTVSGSLSNLSKSVSDSSAQFSKLLAESGQKVADTVTGDITNISKKIADSSSQVSGMIISSGQKLSDTVAESINQFTNTIADSNTQVSKSITESGSKLSESYNKLADAMNAEFDNTLSGSKGYAQQLNVMTKNLTALNSIYELQLQGSNEHLEAAKQLFSGMEEIMVNMKESATDVKQYREEISKLGHNLSAMNTIYGNMLSAMNFTKQ